MVVLLLVAGCLQPGPAGAGVAGEPDDGLTSLRVSVVDALTGAGLANASLELKVPEIGTFRKATDNEGYAAVTLRPAPLCSIAVAHSGHQTAGATLNCTHDQALRIALKPLDATSASPGSTGAVAHATGSTGPVPQAPPTSECVPPVLPNVTADATVGSDGTLRMNLPITVVLVGFPTETTSRLQAALPSFEFTRTHPEYDLPHGTQPMVPNIVYDVRELPPERTKEFFDTLKPVAAGSPAILDGNLAESALASTLRCAGVPLREELPTFAIVHLGNHRVGDHAYAYRGEGSPGFNGLGLSGIRTFGGAEPLLILDASASQDPDSYYGYGGRNHERPIQLSDAALISVLHDAVASATDHRLVHSLARRVTVAPCNSFTVVLGRSAGALDERQVLLHPDDIAEEFRNVTGLPASVHTVELQLPVDDPALEALVRLTAAAFMTIQGPDLLGQLAPVPQEHFRIVGGQAIEAAATAWGQWVDLVWNSYVVVEPGCTPHLAFMINPDPSVGNPFGWGFAPTSPGGHSFVVGARGLAIQDNAVSQAVFGGGDGGFDGLVSHEFGHSIGLNHAQNAWNGAVDDYSFASDRDVMSYRWGGSTITHGAFDKAILMRARAAEAVQEHALAGTLATPGGQAAMLALESWDWRGASQALLPASG